MILLRHGQTPWNLHFGTHRTDPGLPDPGLTPLGRMQAENAARELAGEDLALIVVSPYRRTLETAEIVNARLGLEVLVEPRVRERAGYSCDLGTPRSRLALEWPGHAFDHVDEVWWVEPDEPEAHLDARVGAFRAEMAVRADWSRVLVVTHWGVIRCLTGRTVGNGESVHFDPVTGRHRLRPAISA